MNVENLKLMIRYLMRPKLCAAFDMEVFDEDGNSSSWFFNQTNPNKTIDQIDYYNLDCDTKDKFVRIQPTHCGSVGCVIGHGPYAGIEKHKTESWVEYSYRVFGIAGREWSWLFASGWADIDNTHFGAAKRIYWLINYGLPEDAVSQLYGCSDTCYQDITEAMLKSV